MPTGNNLGDYLARRADELGLDRADQLSHIQRSLDLWYPGKVRAVNLHQGVLRLVATSAPLASDLRMRSTDIMELDSSIKRIAISTN